MGLWFETFPPFLTRVSAVDCDNPTQIYSAMITGRPSLAIYCLRVYSPGGKARGLSLGYTDVIQQLEMKWYTYLKGDFALISPAWLIHFVKINISKILSFGHVVNIKILINILYFFPWTKSSKSGGYLHLYFIQTSQISNAQWPHVASGHHIEEWSCRRSQPWLSDWTVNNDKMAIRIISGLTFWASKSMPLETLFLVYLLNYSVWSKVPGVVISIGKKTIATVYYS